MRSLPYLLFISLLAFSDIRLISTDNSENVNTVPTTEKPKIDIDPIEDQTEEVKVDKDLNEPSSKTDDEVIEREEEAIKLDGLNVAQIREMRKKAEQFKFQAEVDRMMKLIINSLYTNKEIFLRELISNASDALDKIRFMSLTDPSAMRDFPELSIKIQADRINNLLRITDTGIGMTRSELIKQLGTIANSGTTEFLANIEKDKSGNLGDFIGQFGVGFYAVYLVSDSVTVISKHNDDDQYIWESDSSSTFTVTRDPRGNTLRRGTEVVLRLKSSAKEYLEAENLRRLVRQYSQYLSFPIYLWSPTTDQTTSEPAASPTPEASSKESNTPESSVHGETVTTAADSSSKSDEGEVATDTETTSKSSKTSSTPKVKWHWDQINNQKPIWTRKPNEITDEEYDNFYKTLSKTDDKPLARIHFNAEGEVTFKALLYIPSKAPANFLERLVKESSIRLYVRRVFITDKIQDIIPRYLSFIIGIVDSDDLPLNVSRETLQQEKLMKVIQKKLVRKALDMIKKMERSKFDQFWSEFKSGIKLGLIEDDTNRNRLTKILHTPSSRSAAGNTSTTSLAEYVSRMRAQQEDILLVCAESIDAASQSPFAEKFIKHDYEVLYFTDSLDEHALYLIEKYDGVKLKNLARSDVFFDRTEGSKARLRSKRTEFKPLIDFMKAEIPGVNSQIENVVLTDRLLSAPMMLVPQDQGWTGNMERLAQAQSGRREEERLIAQHLAMKKNLEVNPRHPVVMRLNRLINNIAQPGQDTTLLRLTRLLYETAAIHSGYQLNDTSSFAYSLETVLLERLNNLETKTNTQDMDSEVSEDGSKAEEDDHEEKQSDDGDQEKQVPSGESMESEKNLENEEPTVTSDTDKTEL